MDTTELKCNKCGGRLKQITIDTKLCEECGAQILSKGFVEFDTETEIEEKKFIDWGKTMKYHYSPLRNYIEII